MSNKNTDDLVIVTPSYTGVERRKTEREWRRQVEERLHEGALSDRRIENKVDENTQITESVYSSTKEMVAAFNSAKGAFRTLELLARVAKPIVVLLTLIGSIWGVIAAIKSGQPPRA